MSFERIMLGVLAVVFCAWAGVCFGDIMIINWDGTGDYTTIQEAIDAANNGDTVIVEIGIYVENINFGGKTITLTSSDPDDWGVVENTVIDGSSDPNSPAFGTLVTFEGSESEECVLTGFTITNGVNKILPAYGGGVKGNGSKATISNCVITDNVAYYVLIIDDEYGYSAYYYGGGGGIADCYGTIENCIISDNFGGKYGGGIYCSSGGAPTIVDCEITNNQVRGDYSSYGYFGYGGGIYGSSGPIINCLISNNEAGYAGSAVSECSGPIVRCEITNNKSNHDYPKGAVHYTLNDKTLEIRDCIIARNHSYGNAGIWTQESNINLIGNTIWDLVEVYSGKAFVRNCILEEVYPKNSGNFNIEYSNVQSGWAGGVGNIDIYPMFVDEANGDYHLLPISPCINTGDPNFVAQEGEVDIDGEPRVMGKGVDMGADEFFIADGPYIGVSTVELGFYAAEGGANPEEKFFTIFDKGIERLYWKISEDCGWLSVSPESGESAGEEDTVAVSVDITDLSHGEYSSELTITDPNALNSPKIVTVRLCIGHEVLVPYDHPTIQSAIDAANDFDTVIVADGVYTGDGNRDVDFKGKDITVRSENGAESCIIDCESPLYDPNSWHRGFYFSESDGDMHMQILDGFTVTNGMAVMGGAVFCYGNPTIKNCIFKGNMADDSGGGIYCDYPGSPTIESCMIVENTAIYGGGLSDCDGTISNCVISGNTAYSYGGGLLWCDGPISNCIISGNTADNDGGGLYSCDGIIENCTITGNTAADWGGGLCSCDGTIKNCLINGNTTVDRGGGLSYCHGTIINCTITNNISLDYGGGLYFSYGDPKVTNCIVWYNKPTEIHTHETRLTVTYSDILGGWEGEGNIDVEPMFVGGYWNDNGTPNPNDDFWVEGDDYHLRWDSPCVDAGDPGFVAGEGEVDIDGEPRVMGGRVDMGADEVGEKQADFTRDGRIDVSDLAVLSRSWGTQEGEMRWYVLSDLFEDGEIGLDDLVLFVGDWLWAADWRQ